MAVNEESAPADEPILNLSGISKQFSGVKALDNVDFTLFSSEVHALMGENGAGKSTLINIVSGLLHQTSGRIRLAGKEMTFDNSMQAQKAGISTITQEFHLVPQLTVAENIFLGREPAGKVGLLDWSRIRRHAAELLDELGLKVSLNAPVEYLSVGDRQLVEVAKALSREFRIITMDEPTAALSAAEVERLFEIIKKLKRRGVAVLYVSHRLGEIFRIADRVTVLRDGKCVGTRRVSEITEDEVVRMMLGYELKKKATLYEVISEKSSVAVSVNNLVVPGYLSNVSFQLRFGEVLGCAGLAGSGRYELTQALFGLLPISSGHMELSGRDARFQGPMDAMRHGLYMLPEDRKVEGIFPDLTVLENLVLVGKRLLRFTSDLLINNREEDKRYQEIRELLKIQATSPSQGITQLSGGNQQKVMIGRSLVSNARILLLNDPTRGVDIGTRVDIHTIIRALARDGYAIVVSSSDIPELVSISDRCLVLVAGRMNGLLERAQINEDDVTALAIGQKISRNNR
jgi:ABC-type sugar transport system ATPase subunit